MILVTARVDFADKGQIRSDFGASAVMREFWFSPYKIFCRLIKGRYQICASLMFSTEADGGNSVSAAIRFEDFFTGTEGNARSPFLKDLLSSSYIFFYFACYQGSSFLDIFSLDCDTILISFSLLWTSAYCILLMHIIQSISCVVPEFWHVDVVLFSKKINTKDFTF